LRVAAYIRVSTDEQTEKGNSLNEQKERLEAYCRAMGWNSPIFYKDEGFSAGDLKRPAINKLIDAVKKDNYDILLTTKLDRLSRNLLDLLQTILLLTEYKCAYVSATESFDTSTAAGRMVLQLLGVFAEFERGRISERVKDNMNSLARNTNKALSGPCFGYDIVEGMYKINEKEAEQIKYMFELADKGVGSRSIAKALNERDVLTKRGKMWDSTNVLRLLKNETVAGIRVFNKRKKVNNKIEIRPKEEWIINENNHEAIIDPDFFRDVQCILDARGHNKKHAESETYLLTGVLKCGQCGRGMKGSTARVTRGEKKYLYHRYICSSYVLNYGCKHHFAHRDEIENEVIQMIKKVAMTSVAELEIKVATKSMKEEIQETETIIKRLSQQMQRQIEAHSKGLIEDEDLKLANERIKEERKLHRAKLEMLKENNGSVEFVKENVKKLLGDITNFDRKKAKLGIFKLIESLELKDKNIDVVWRA